MLHGGDYNPDQWLHRPDILAEDPKLMKSAGVNAVSLGIFAWAALEPAEGDYRFDWLDDTFDRLDEHGIGILLATPAAARPHWLGHAYPEVLPVNEHDVREPSRGRHWFCRSSAVYKERVRRINGLLSARYSSHPALLGWHINNEYGGAPNYAHCYCDLCMAGFIHWLKERYGHDLDALNRAWWTAFWSHTYTDWSQIRPNDPTNEACMLSWRRYQSDLVIDFARHEIAAVRKYSDHPITTNFHGHMRFFDHRKMASLLDFLSFDAYPRIEGSADDRKSRMWVSYVSDIVRGFALDRNWVLLESCPSQPQHKPLQRLKRPGVHRLLSFQHVAHGADGVMYFQWRAGRGGKEKLHGAVIMQDAPPDTRVFGEVAELGKDLEKLTGVVGGAAPAEVAIIWDVHSEWAWECSHGLQSEPTPLEELSVHYEPFWKRGVGVDIVDATLDLERYRLIVVPSVFLLRPGFVERLESAAREGAQVVVHPLSGWVDDDLNILPEGRLGPKLRQLCGIRPREIDFLRRDEVVALEPSEWTEGSARHRCDIVDVSDAEILLRYAGEFYNGRPALTRRATGKGAFWYCAAGLEPRGYERLYERITEVAAVRTLPVKADDGIFLRERVTGDQRFIFALNPSDAPQTLTLGPGWTSVLTGAQLPKSVAIEPYDLVVATREGSSSR